MSRARFRRATLPARSWLNLSKPLPPAACIALPTSLRAGWVHNVAALAISVDLLMDLIAFQLIAPHAIAKLHQTDVPSTSPFANLILLDIIIRWYWLLMTQQSQNRWVSVRLLSWQAPWQAKPSRSRRRANCPPWENTSVFPLTTHLWPTLSYALLHKEQRHTNRGTKSWCPCLWPLYYGLYYCTLVKSSLKLIDQCETMP